MLSWYAVAAYWSCAAAATAAAQDSFNCQGQGDSRGLSRSLKASRQQLTIAVSSKLHRRLDKFMPRDKTGAFRAMEAQVLRWRAKVVLGIMPMMAWCKDHGFTQVESDDLNHGAPGTSCAVHCLLGLFTATVTNRAHPLMGWLEVYNAKTYITSTARL